MATRAELMEESQSIASMIRNSPDNPSITSELRRMAGEHGEWAYDLVVDALVDGSDNCYSQLDSDSYSKRSQEYDPIQDGASRIVVTHWEEIWQEEPSGMIFVLSELVSEDCRKLRQEAGLTKIEAEVFSYWLQGQGVISIWQTMTRYDGRAYSRRTLYKALACARVKVAVCESLGWRTCLAEDVARGKVAHDIARTPPSKVGVLIAP